MKHKAIIEITAENIVNGMCEHHFNFKGIDLGVMWFDPSRDVVRISVEHPALPATPEGGEIMVMGIGEIHQAIEDYVPPLAVNAGDSTYTISSGDITYSTIGSGESWGTVCGTAITTNDGWVTVDWDTDNGVLKLNDKPKRTPDWIIRDKAGEPDNFGQQSITCSG